MYVKYAVLGNFHYNNRYNLKLFLSMNVFENICRTIFRICFIFKRGYSLRNACFHKFVLWRNLKLYPIETV